MCRGDGVTNKGSIPTKKIQLPFSFQNIRLLWIKNPKKEDKLARSEKIRFFPQAMIVATLLLLPLLASQSLGLSDSVFYLGETIKHGSGRSLWRQVSEKHCRHNNHNFLFSSSPSSIAVVVMVVPILLLSSTLPSLAWLRLYISYRDR